MTLMVTGEDNEVEQAVKQLYKLLEVIKVTDLAADEAITREMVLVKVAAKGGQRAEIMQIAEVYNARSRCDAEFTHDRGDWQRGSDRILPRNDAYFRDP